mgnify:CR=1 FL=1
MALTFADFLAQAMAQPILFVILVLIIGVTAVSGATDAPNAIATVVSTRCLKPNTAIGLAAVFNFVGLVGMTFISTAVAKTMFGMVDFSGNTDAALLALVAAMIGAIGWGIFCWFFGIPCSKSHSLMAGFALGWVFTKIIERVFEMANRQAANIVFTAIQDLCALALSFLHGAQDGQKFMSIAMLGIALSFGSSTPDAGGFPMWVMITCSLAISAGTVVGGKRIIKSVGMDMVKLEKYQGVAANFSTVFTLLFASLTGMPVSTGHCNTSAIMGVGASRSIKRVNWSIAKNMLLAWVITFPACGLIGFVLAKLFMMLA